MNKSETLYLFSLAEYASALEMLAAAKTATHPEMVRGFIAHATDEYRHASLFRSMSKTAALKQGVSALSHDSMSVKTERYVDTEQFLIEKYTDSEFAVFVAVHESLAVREFNWLKSKLDADSDKNILRVIIHDEEEHRESVLDDEKRHAELAASWVAKNLGWSRHFLMIKHYLLAKVRKARGSLVPYVGPFFYWCSVPFTLLSLVSVRVVGRGPDSLSGSWLSENM